MNQTHRNVDEALDSLGEEGGTVEVDHDQGSAEIDVVEADRLGVRVRGVRVNRDRAIDVEHEAKELPDRLTGALPERLEPVEVAPELKGARLRTQPRNREFFEVDVTPERTDIRKTKVDAEGERSPTDWTMTRDQLERLIDDARGPDAPPEAPAGPAPEDDGAG